MHIYHPHFFLQVAAAAEKAEARIASEKANYAC